MNEPGLDKQDRLRRERGENADEEELRTLLEPQFPHSMLPFAPPSFADFLTVPLVDTGEE